MEFRYVLEPRAQLEYENAVLWYCERSERAGQNFEKEVSKKLQGIVSHSKRYRITKKPFRETLIEKFPFSIVYVVNDALAIVVVISIFHNSRNPKAKYPA